ncbi:MAG: hypothetical protein FWB95_07600 [Treponema sp.]|nr:hypothetical protein [Treponema sp.]
MNLFYATFIPGLQNFIAVVVRERLSDVKINKLLDGAVLFETETSYDKLNFLCFNNIFAVINLSEGNHAKNAKIRNERKGDENFYTAEIENCIKYFIKESNSSPLKTPCNSVFNIKTIADNSSNIKTFRIIVSNENVPAAIDEKLRAEAEKQISRLSGLKVNRVLADTEFWFLRRNEGFSIFMKRLTLRSSWEKTLHKGELPPPLAWTLCRMADLSHNDTALDPFCGYGSIPGAAVKYFHITKFIACDNDEDTFKYTYNKFKKRKSGGIILHNMDFIKLPSVIENKTIDVIVTDPPWGHHKEIDNKGFLIKMFDIFYKLLKDGGRAVLLYVNDDVFKNAIPDFFEIQTQTPVLLSGKKAVIYALKKNN